MLMVDILSVDGVASRELVDGSFLTEAVGGVFLVVAFGVVVKEDEMAEPEGAETDGGQKLVRLIKKGTAPAKLADLAVGGLRFHELWRKSRVCNMSVKKR
jgi:hypothetical protein